MELLARLTELDVPWSIATSGYIESAAPMIEMLHVPEGVPIVTRDQVAHAKPDPDLFLAADPRRTARAAEPATSSAYAHGPTGPRAGSVEACSPITAPSTEPIAIAAASSESQISGSTRRRRSQNVGPAAPGVILRDHAA